MTALTPHRHLLVAALGFYVACLVFSRAPFFIHYFAFRLDGDYGSYAWEAQKILDGIWPDLAIRPPGYILFLAAYRALSPSIYGLLIVQNLVSLAAGALLIFAAWRWRPAFALPCAIAVLAAQFGDQSLTFDSSVQSDSLLGNLFTVSFACLIVGLTSGRRRWLAGSGAAMALAIWTKPAGLFLVAILALTLIYLWRARARGGSARMAVALTAPFIVLLLALSAYNAAKASDFSVSSWGEMNLAGATMILWETDSSYPATVNADIVRLQGFYNRGEREAVRTSRDPDVLYPNFYRGFNVLFAAGRIFPATVDSYQTERAWIRRVAADSILKNPDIYAKFVATNLWYYFTNPGRIVGGFTAFYREVLPDRAAFILDMRQRLATGEAYWMFSRLGADYLIDTPNPLPGFVVSDAGSKAMRAELKPTWLLTAYESVLAPFKAVFHSFGWTAAFAVVWLAALARWWWRALDRDAFLVAVGATYVVSSALLVSLVEMAIPRYSYSTLPLFYVTVTIGIIALLQRRKEAI